MKNIKSFQCPNNKDGIGMLVLIQSSAAHMAYGNCKPFCDGIQPCDILNTNIIDDVENRTLQCHCYSQDTCTDLAIYLPHDVDTDYAVPMEICNIDTRLLE